jgi:ribonuclease BN (tRNA processing enzyme)
LPESGILLDAGTGAFRLAPLIETETLDVLLSHAHIDHTFGLTFLLDILSQRSLRKVRIWGEAAKIAAIRSHLFHELIFPVPLQAEWVAIDGRPEFPIGDARVSWRPQQHPGGSVAYRLDWPEQGKRLIYATDTSGDTSDQHAQWSNGADLLMHECYFRDDSEQWAKKTGHSWTSRVAEVAKLSQPAKLLLTHINPNDHSDDPTDIEAIRGHLDGEVMLAEDGLSIDF